MSADPLSRLHIEVIDKKLHGLTPINAERHCIFKVHEQLRKVNEKAYEPILLAIGPYSDHRKIGKGLLEEHKMRYLKQMLQRKNESSVEAYIRTLSGLEERARNCYAERISLTTYEFVEMMLLDGCFIIEFFRKYRMPEPGDEHDPIFQISWMLPQVTRDLLLFENQLPFFVLAELLMMIESSQTPLPTHVGHLGEHPINIEQNNEITCLESSISIDQRVRLRTLATNFFQRQPPFQAGDAMGLNSDMIEKKVVHLLQTHNACTPSPAKIRKYREDGDKFKKADFKHLLDLIHTLVKLSIHDMELDRAIECKEVGVKFIMETMIGRKKKSIRNADVDRSGKKGIKVWNSKPYGKDLCEAGENERCQSTPDVNSLQEAEVSTWTNDVGKKKHWGPICMFRMVEKFMRLPFLNMIENWNSIPAGRELKDTITPIPNATELKESGVKFKKAKQRNMFGIQFSNGILEIPPLRIEDDTETTLRNLIAYEQYSPHSIPDSNYATDYVCFIDDLIESPKDVELLRQKGIIENWLGDDEVASSMVNKLRHRVIVDPPKSFYAQAYIDINKYCAKRRNRWKAKLRHDYFHSPWALLSVLAAFLLLGLAFTQTVFSILH